LFAIAVLAVWLRIRASEEDCARYVSKGVVFKHKRQNWTSLPHNPLFYIRRVCLLASCVYAFIVFMNCPWRREEMVRIEIDDEVWQVYKEVVGSNESQDRRKA